MPTKTPARLASVSLGLQPLGESLNGKANERTAKGRKNVSGVKVSPVRRAGSPTKRREQPNASKRRRATGRSGSQHSTDGAGSSQVLKEPQRQATRKHAATAAGVVEHTGARVTHCRICAVKIDEEGVNALFPFDPLELLLLSEATRPEPDCTMKIRPTWFVGLCTLHAYGFLKIYRAHNHTTWSEAPDSDNDQGAYVWNEGYEQWDPPTELQYTIYLAKWLHRAVLRISKKLPLVRCENYPMKHGARPYRCEHFASVRYNGFWVCKGCVSNKPKHIPLCFSPSGNTNTEFPKITFVCAANTVEEFIASIRLHIPLEWKHIVKIRQVTTRP